MTFRVARRRSRPHQPSTVANAINGYAALGRVALDPDGVVSWPGVWLLLATVGDTLGPRAAQDLSRYLGMPPAEAAAAAKALLADDHRGIAAAAGRWLEAEVAKRLGVQAPPVPTQSQLDAWASDHTDGLIPTFPVRISPDALALFATAMLTKISWHTPLGTDDSGRLVLTDELQAIVDTDAAGLVAVASPTSTDDVAVISVIAGPEVARPDVWRAVDEVVALADAGKLHHRLLSDSARRDGHAWTIRTETIETTTLDTRAIWTTRLPAWDLSSKLRLDAAPGVADVAQALLEACAVHPARVETAQAARARYDAKGFEAAAVTGMQAFLAGVPRFVTRDVQYVDVDFNRPHAVTAVARGGRWDGVRLFDAWVDPDG